MKKIYKGKFKKGLKQSKVIEPLKEEEVEIEEEKTSMK